MFSLFQPKTLVAIDHIRNVNKQNPTLKLISRTEASNINKADTVKIIDKLRILTGKEHPKIKVQRLRKIRVWTFGSLVHQINSF